jgi:hypothetical protein
MEGWSNGVTGNPWDNRMPNVKAQLPNQIRSSNDQESENKEFYMSFSALSIDLKFGFWHLGLGI